jgi:hypothetical protein
LRRRSVDLFRIPDSEVHVKKVSIGYIAPLAAALLLSVSGVAAAAEAYTARAETKSADGKVLTAPVAFSVDRMLTVAERDAVINALKTGGHAAAKKALAGLKEIGWIEGGSGKRVPVKFAFARSMGSGRLLTLVSDQAIAYIGGNIPDAKPKEGFDMTYAILILDSEGKGNGEIVPAAKLKLRDDGALTTEDYGAETVWLKEIAPK